MAENEEILSHYCLFPIQLLYKYCSISSIPFNVQIPRA